MSPRILVVLVLGAALAAPAVAQRPRPGSPSTGPTLGIPSLPRTVDVQVRVVNTNDRPYSEPVRVQLLNSSGIPVTETFTSGEGFAEFRAVNPGSYRIRASGINIETTTTDPFQIILGEGMHMEYVRVPLLASAQQQSSGGPPTVDAAEMKVPGKAKKEFDKGMEAFSRADYRKATEKFQKAIQLYPQYARAYNNLGIAWIKQDDAVQARQAFQNAIQVDDHFAPAYLNLARMAYLKKDYSEGQKLVDRTLAVEPKNVEGLALLANLEYATKDYAKALLTARKVHSLPHENLAKVHLVAANVLLLQHQDQEALSEMELFMKEDPQSPMIPKVRQAMASIQAQAH